MLWRAFQFYKLLCVNMFVIKIVSWILHHYFVNLP